MNIQGVISDKIKYLCCLFLTGILITAHYRDVHAAKTADITLNVEQVFIKNSSRDVDEVFRYELTALEIMNPMPPGTSGGIYSFTQAGTSTKDIVMTFTSPGIYRYRLSVDSSAGAAGYSYDPQLYTVVVYMKSTNGQLSAQLVIETGDGDKSGGLRFVNSYTPLVSDPELMVDPPIRKTVSGSPSKPFAFTFTMTARDPAFPMPAGSVNGVKRVTVTGAGSAAFGTWSYTREGTYYYDIAEESAAGTGYAYDKSVYTITDLVKDVDGRLTVTRTVTNSGNKPVGSFIFINTYKKNNSGEESGGSWADDADDTAATGENNQGTLIYIDDKVPKAGGSIAGDNVPKVGDDVNLERYTAIFFLAAVGASGCIICRIFTKSRLIRTILWLLPAASVLVMLFSGNKLWEGLRICQAGDRSYEILRQQVRHQKDRPDPEERTGMPADTPPVVIDFEALRRMNPDTAAWLYCPDTVIDYPVMRADDYDWYLHHLPDGTGNAAGTLFLDYNCPEDFSGRLSIIYGHHMKSGRMFGSLKGYKKQAYYERHPCLYLYTEQENYRIDLVYGFVIGAGEWRERAFMYDINLGALLDYGSSKTTFHSNVGYAEDDKFVALATCSYEFDDARYIVIGVLQPESSLTD